MKNFIILLLVCTMHSILFGQVDIHHNGFGDTNVNGTVVNIASDEDDITISFYIVNRSGVNKEYRFRRTKLSNTFSSLHDYLEEDDIHYPCNVDTFTSASTQTVEDNDSTLVKADYMVTNEGSALFRYYVLDVANNDSVIDSVDVYINSFLSLKNNKNDFIVYPNPANGELNVSISENNMSISICNIIGKNVSENELFKGKNILNIGMLVPGIYFYSIKRNGKIIETKKLIIK